VSVEDYHDPTAGLGGAPPARSALGLRLVLALFGLVVCAGGAALFLTIAWAPGVAALLAALAVVALVDVVVIVRRRRREGEQ
jgi:glycerol uptake facilitator-like aquaporin